MNQVLGLVLLCLSSLPVDECVVPKNPEDIKSGHAGAVVGQFTAFEMPENECYRTLIELISHYADYKNGKIAPEGMYWRLVCGDTTMTLGEHK